MHTDQPHDRVHTPLFMHELLHALSPGARVLDLGCGPGSFHYGAYPDLSIVAMDLDRPAEASTWPGNVRFQRGAAEALPFEDRVFDLIIANFVFEHTGNFARALAESDRVLAPNGWLYLSVPNAKTFEDNLYRALFAGGGHRQRFRLGAILRTVYAHTGLKLMAFADWPAGFTFFEGREGLRQFTLALVDALRRSGRADVSLYANFVMSFQKVGGAGHRGVPRVCSYCGSGNFDQLPDADAREWYCRVCGRTTAVRAIRLDELDWLDAEARALQASWWRQGRHGLVRSLRRLLGMSGR